MIKSMTGFGRGEMDSGGRRYMVEVRAVNNRYLDCSVKMPRAYFYLEDDIRTRVGETISRGKIDIFLNIEDTGSGANSLHLNEPLARAYIESLRRIGKIGKDAGVSQKITAAQIAQFPEVLTPENSVEYPEAAQADILSALDQALEEFDGMRTREGQRLAEDISERMRTIEDYVGRIEARSPETVKEYRARLEEKLREVLADSDIDEHMILNEAAIYADKIAVDEETVRLRSHLSQLGEMLHSDGAVGRKMDFLIQEFNREANTIGSKCNDLDISRTVVDLKAEIEKIREQVQNVE